MQAEAMQERYAPGKEFRYVGGDAGLDLVNTADWTDRGLESDRLTDYRRLLEWARGAGVVDATAERRLRRNAEAHPRQASAALARTLDARDVLHGTFVAVAAGRVSAAELGAFNRLVAITVPQLRIARGASGELMPAFDGFGESLDSVLWAVTWSAGNLLLSDESARIKICGGMDCGWVYVDRSRNGLRRWCEMEVCGTVAKNRRRAGKDA
jgi:predicted RNA-binding Zn ribbon-like protein